VVADTEEVEVYLLDHSYLEQQFEQQAAFKARFYKYLGSLLAQRLCKTSAMLAQLSGTQFTLFSIIAHLSNLLDYNTHLSLPAQRPQQQQNSMLFRKFGIDPNENVIEGKRV
jgi:hypothetical protein